MLWILVTCVIAVKIDAAAISKETNLVFLQIISRHGDRAPFSTYPKDPNAGYVWPNGKGKLTNLGKKQQLMLGRHIRSMYRNFISSDPNEVKAASSEADRCLRSAQAHLAGLYEPDPQWVFHEPLKWQPIPVTYTPEKEDKMLTLAYDCPLAIEESRKLVKPIYEENKIKYKEMFENITLISGLNLLDETSYGSSKFSNTLILFDTLFVQKTHNLVIPDWAKFYWKELEEIFNKYFSTFYSTATLKRLRSGPFIEKLTDMMTNKMSGHLPQQKVQFYSTHDTVLATLLSALGMFNGRRPPYSSTILVELHKDLKQEHFVRFLYLNSTTPELGEQKSHVLKLNGCSELCPFDYFKNLVKEIIPIDLAKECELKE